MTQDNESSHDWQEIAAEVSKETDPKKLYRLVDELLAALDEQERPKNVTQRRA